jgi:hypothetical protein
MGLLEWDVFEEMVFDPRRRPPLDSGQRGAGPAAQGWFMDALARRVAGVDRSLGLEPKFRW